VNEGDIERDSEIHVGEALSDIREGLGQNHPNLLLGEQAMIRFEDQLTRRWPSSSILQ
jgi:hypothetical protein